MKAIIVVMMCCVLNFVARGDVLDKIVSTVGKRDVVEYEIRDAGKIEQIVETKVGSREIYFVCESIEEREPVIYKLVRTQYYGSISKGYTSYLVLGKERRDPMYIVYKDKVLEVERVAKIATLEDEK